MRLPKILVLTHLRRAGSVADGPVDQQHVQGRDVGGGRGGGQRVVVAAGTCFEVLTHKTMQDAVRRYGMARERRTPAQDPGTNTEGSLRAAVPDDHLGLVDRLVVPQRPGRAACGCFVNPHKPMQDAVRK